MIRPSNPPIRSDLMAPIAAAPPPPDTSTVMPIARSSRNARSGHLDAGQLVPDAVAERAALRALREDALLLQRLAEGPVGVAVPQLAEGRLADVAEGHVDRAGVHVAVRVDAGGLPGIEAGLHEGVGHVEEALADALLRRDRRLEGHVQLVLLALGERLLDLLVADVDVDVPQVEREDLVLLLGRWRQRDQLLRRLLRLPLRVEHVLELEGRDDLVVLQPVQYLAEVPLVERRDRAGDADAGIRLAQLVPRLLQVR